MSSISEFTRVPLQERSLSSLAGIDSIEHGSFLDEEALDMMKQRGTYYVPTLMAAQGLKERLEDGYLPPAVAAKARLAMAALNETVRKAIAKGVKIAAGTDSSVYPHGRNTEELGLLVNLGMKPIDALKAAKPSTRREP